MKPVLQALLVADHVYVDQATGKKIVAGIFHRLCFQKQENPPQVQQQGGQVTIQIGPGGQQAGSPFCYISLTEVHGEQAFELRYVDLANDRVLLATGFTTKSDSPLKTIEVVLPLPRLPVPAAGAFALELLCNNEPIGSHRIIVDELQPEE